MVSVAGFAQGSKRVHEAYNLMPVLVAWDQESQGVL